MPVLLDDQTSLEILAAHVVTTPPKIRCLICLLLGLEVVEEDGALLRLLTPVLDNDARAVDDLAGVALAVDLACKNH